MAPMLGCRQAAQPVSYTRQLIVRVSFPPSPDVSLSVMSDGAPTNPTRERGAFPPSPCHAGCHACTRVSSLRCHGLQLSPATACLHCPILHGYCKDNLRNREEQHAFCIFLFEVLCMYYLVHVNWVRSWGAQTGACPCNAQSVTIRSSNQRTPALLSCPSSSEPQTMIRSRAFFAQLSIHSCTAFCET